MIASLLLSLPLAGVVSVDYRLELVLADPPVWRVEATARGLDRRDRDLRWVLEDWGHFSRLGVPYVLDLVADPPATPDGPDAWRVEVPSSWDGTASVRYDLRCLPLDGPRQSRFGLLPFLAEDFSRGASSNTLVEPRVGGARVEGPRVLKLVAPEGWRVASGWEGLGEREQVVTSFGDLPRGVIVFGRPVNLRVAQDEVARYEVVQFGDTSDVTATVLEAARALVPAYAATTGRPPRGPVRLFVDPAGSGGVATDAGTVIGWKEPTQGYERSPYWLVLVAHELLHEWLGLQLRFDTALVWAQEGFTDYEAIRHMAATDVVPRNWFAERIHELDRSARQHPTFGVRAFADPEVDWRYPAHEDYAYHGGCALAFALDVRLERGGEGGLGAVLAGLLDEPAEELDLERLLRALSKAGAGQLVRRHVEDLEPWPEPRAALESLGFRAIDDEGRYEVVDPERVARFLERRR